MSEGYHNPNLAAAKAFLDRLDRNGIFTFQTFDDNKQRKNPRLARVFHGTLDQHHAALTRFQQQGAGIFVMVNQGDGIVHPGNKTCRTSKNVVAVRSVFVDLDGSPLDPVLAALHPDIVVESSPGRWHGYWLTDDCPLSDFTKRQLQIARKFDGDAAVADLPRVMRVPGFFHQKAGPFMTHITFLE
ncbi:MAG: DNA-primase RepB domain-containing protein [Rhodoferax sp.]|nr:DNA-primase RepB domain-containing protein [Rhodoferax sp.]